MYPWWGRPPRGLGCPPAPPWATAAAAAVGPEGGRGVEAPKDYTKLRQTIQSPNRLYKAPTDFTNPLQIIQSPRKTIESYKKYTKT